MDPPLPDTRETTIQPDAEAVNGPGIFNLPTSYALQPKRVAMLRHAIDAEDGFPPWPHNPSSRQYTIYRGNDHIKYDIYGVSRHLDTASCRSMSPLARRADCVRATGLVALILHGLQLPVAREPL